MIAAIITLDPVVIAVALQVKFMTAAMGARNHVGHRRRKSYIVDAIELGIEVLRQAIAAGQVTPEEVARRIHSKQKEADAAEDRVDRRINEGTE